jgi:transposase
MGREIRADYAQRFLLPPSLEEWVGPEHPARMVRELVDHLDLPALGFTHVEQADGRPYYGANLLLKVWLYGYLTRVRSSRKLEQACRDQMALIWLTGRHTPDHNTLWRFFQGYRGALRQLFKAVVKLALQSGAAGVALHALDGTKLAAAASRHGVWGKEKLAQRLAELDTAIEEAFAQIEAAEAQESGAVHLPADWQEQLLTREKLRELHDELVTQQRQYGHPGEREARVMPVEGRKVPGYNAQIVVDDASGVIVAEQVTVEETDTQQLVPLLDEVQANVGRVAEQTVADAGYHTGAQLAAAETRQYPVVVRQPKEPPRASDPAGEWQRSRFHYDAAQDCCVCPRGGVLRFERILPAHDGHQEARRYRCTQFRTCPVRAQCSADRRGRTIDRDRHHGAVERQRAKQRAPEVQAQLKRRMAIVEPVFGVIKEAMGFRRWTVVGLEAVRAQWALVCTAYNLKKLYRVWATQRLALAA